MAEILKELKQLQSRINGDLSWNAPGHSGPTPEEVLRYLSTLIDLLVRSLEGELTDE